MGPGHRNRRVHRCNRGLHPGRDLDGDSSLRRMRKRQTDALANVLGQLHVGRVRSVECMRPGERGVHAWSRRADAHCKLHDLRHAQRIPFVQRIDVHVERMDGVERVHVV